MAHNGDDAARSQTFSPPSNYDELIRDYGDLVKWCVARVCKEQRLFNDTLQECYVKIIRMDLLARYSSDVPDYDGMIFKGYLRRACINAARTFVGRDLKRRDFESVSPQTEDGFDFMDIVPSPERSSRDHKEALAHALMEPKSLSAQVWDEVEKLVWERQTDMAPRLIEVLRLSLLGYQDTEIGVMFEITHARVWQYRKKLQAILIEYAARDSVKVA